MEVRTPTPPPSQFCGRCQSRKHGCRVDRYHLLLLRKRHKQKFPTWGAPIVHRIVASLNREDDSAVKMRLQLSLVTKFADIFECIVAGRGTGRTDDASTLVVILVGVKQTSSSSEKRDLTGSPEEDVTIPPTKAATTGASTEREGDWIAVQRKKAGTGKVKPAVCVGTGGSGRKGGECFADHRRASVPV